MFTAATFPVRSLLCAALLSGMPAIAQAADNVTPTSEFATWCQADQHGTEFSYCVGVLGGTRSVLTLNAEIRREHQDDSEALRVKAMMCGNPTPVEMVSAFLTWFNTHPDAATTDFRISVVMALVSTWPCNDA